MAKVTYKDAGVDLDIYRQSMARLPRAGKNVHPPGSSPGRWFRRPVPARFQQPPLRPQLRRSRVGVLYRRGGHEAESGMRHGRPHDRGHRPGGHERQRRPVLRGGAAVLPRLRGDAQGRSALLEQLVEGVDRRAASRPTVPCWAAKRRSCPTYTPPAITTWPAFASAWSRASRSSTARPSRPTTWCWAWPRPACTPTATAWPARSSSTSPA